MNTNAPQPEHAETPAQPDAVPHPAHVHPALRTSALATLWDEARAFVSFMFELFNVDHLRTTGISRRRGVQLSAYLANIESGLRRLILAAALVFTPPAPRASTPRPPPPIAPAKRKPKRYRAGLRIIRLASPDPTPAIPSQFAGKARPAPWKSYGHMPYQGDPLLGLQYATRPRDHIVSLRARNPLDRWVRLSPRDPDWRRPEPQDAWATQEDPSPRQPRTRRKSPRKRKPPRTLEGLPDSLWDWRRREEAWAHPIPAPDFAARLEALQRIVAHPGGLITRTARRLQSLRGPVRSRAATRWPTQRPPRRAQDFVRRTYREDFAPRCHARILDTS